jgi:hypothetical protein
MAVYIYITTWCICNIPVGESVDDLSVRIFNHRNASGFGFLTWNPGTSGTISQVASSHVDHILGFILYRVTWVLCIYIYIHTYIYVYIYLYNIIYIHQETQLDSVDSIIPSRSSRASWLGRGDRASQQELVQTWVSPNSYLYCLYIYIYIYISV